MLGQTHCSGASAHCVGSAPRVSSVRVSRSTCRQVAATAAAAAAAAAAAPASNDASASTSKPAPPARRRTVKLGGATSSRPRRQQGAQPGDEVEAEFEERPESNSRTQDRPLQDVTLAELDLDDDSHLQYLEDGERASSSSSSGNSRQDDASTSGRQTPRRSFNTPPSTSGTSQRSSQPRQAASSIQQRQSGGPQAVQAGRAGKRKPWQYSPGMQLPEHDPMFLPSLTDEDLAKDPADHRSGFVAVIGRPNAGKSTLINKIVGQKLSIVSFKPQTTRHRIMGIASDTDYQMILFDTPGIIETKRTKLEQRMMAAVVSSLQNSEAIIAVVDAVDKPKEALAMFQPGSDWSGPPMAVLINKTDLLTPEELEELDTWYKTECKAEIVMHGSALLGTGIDALKAWAVTKLPEGPTLYPKGIVSEMPERFFVSEIVRERIFHLYDQEIPYAVQVEILEFKERPGKKDFISVLILVEKESQINIMVGKGGDAMKRLGSASRSAIEAFIERPVYLEMKVKLSKDWRENKEALTQYGYYDQL